MPAQGQRRLLPCRCVCCRERKAAPVQKERNYQSAPTMGIQSPTASISRYRVEGNLAKPIIETVRRGLKSIKNPLKRPLDGLLFISHTSRISRGLHLFLAPFSYSLCELIRKRFPRTCFINMSCWRAQSAWQKPARGIYLETKNRF